MRHFYFLAATVLLSAAGICGGAPRAFAHASDHADSGEAAAGAGRKFVNVDPLTLPVIDNTGVVSNITVAVALDCDEAKADDVKKQLPVLTDAYIQNLYGSLNKRDALAGGVLQVALIKQRLVAITNKVMGDGEVRDVLLQVVQQRGI